MTGAYEAVNGPLSPDQVPFIFAEQANLGPNVGPEEAYTQFAAAMAVGSTVLMQHPWRTSQDPRIDSLLSAISSTLVDMGQRHLGVAREHDDAIEMHIDYARTKHQEFVDFHNIALGQGRPLAKKQLLDLYLSDFVVNRRGRANPYEDAATLDVVDQLINDWLTHEASGSYQAILTDIHASYWMVFAAMFDFGRMLERSGSRLNSRAMVRAQRFMAPFVEQWRNAKLAED